MPICWALRPATITLGGSSAGGGSPEPVASISAAATEPRAPSAAEMAKIRTPAGSTAHAGQPERGT